MRESPVFKDIIMEFYEKNKTLDWNNAWEKYHNLKTSDCIKVWEKYHNLVTSECHNARESPLFEDIRLQ